MRRDCYYVGSDRKRRGCFIIRDVVKIVLGQDQRAIYFSRSPVPYPSDAIRKHGRWPSRSKRAVCTEVVSKAHWTLRLPARRLARVYKLAAVRI